MPTKASSSTADNHVEFGDNKTSVSVPDSRKDARKKAKTRIWFTEEARWPADWLVAFGPESVDVVTTAKTLLEFFDLDDRLPDTESPSAFDDETRRAVLVLLRCLCQDAKAEALTLAGAPLGPSETDIAEGTNSFPDGSWHLMPVKPLWEKVCRYCFRFGWVAPVVPEATEIRTPGQTLELVQAVETWLQEREREVSGNAISETMNQSDAPNQPELSLEVKAIKESLASLSGELKAHAAQPQKKPSTKNCPAHRPADTDFKKDAQNGDGWLYGRNSGDYRSYQDMATAKNVDVEGLKLSIDRDRKRRPEIWAEQRRPPRRKNDVSTRMTYSGAKKHC